jgi:methylated-DNA-[protein]-cysteine S-methyltransferase
MPTAPSLSQLSQQYCMFDTAVGPCGVAWTERGLTRVQLPEADRSATEQRMRQGCSGAGNAPPEVGRVIAGIERYLAGEKIDFAFATLDLTGIGTFHRQVYDAARRIGWGETTTYGDLARQVRLPGAARAVGQALGRNPLPIVVPCHRILASGGKIGGFSAFGGAATKERLLALEGRANQLSLLPEPATPRSARAPGGAHRRVGSAGGRK